MRITYDMSNSTIIELGVEHTQDAPLAFDQNTAPRGQLRLQEVEWSTEEPSAPSIWATGASIKDILK